jgi:hypothetical protein
MAISPTGMLVFPHNTHFGRARVRARLTRNMDNRIDIEFDSILIQAVVDGLLVN